MLSADYSMAFPYSSMRDDHFTFVFSSVLRAGDIVQLHMLLKARVIEYKDILKEKGELQAVG